VEEGIAVIHSDEGDNTIKFETISNNDEIRMAKPEGMPNR
jgi:hypothetical protein